MTILDQQTNKQIRDKIIAANNVCDRLLSLLQSLGTDFNKTLFYFRARVKAFDSIVKKIRDRQAEGKRDYSFADLTDLVGLRLVTLYDKELVDAWSIARQLMDVGGRGQRPLFTNNRAWGAIDHINFYTRASGTPTVADPYRNLYHLIHAELLQYLSSTNTPESQMLSKVRGILRQNPKDRAYSSLHVVAFANFNDGKADVAIPVEIQIRTAIEDIWGEIAHHNVYKTKHPFLWTEQLQQTYNQASTKADQLKGMMDVLPMQIQDIGYAFVTVGGLLQQFQRPNGQYSFSIILSYIAIVLNAGIRGTYIDQELSRALGEYEAEFRSRRRPSYLRNCAKKVDDIKNSIERKIQDLNTRKSVSILLDFEKIRLEAIELEGRISGKANLPRHDRQSLQGMFLRLHQRLAELQQSEIMLIRPVTVLKFWEYFLLRHCHAMAAQDALRSAYESLATDDSLADWSIYRILVPRHMAAQSISNLQEFSATIGKSGGPESTYAYCKSLVSQALHFCKEALDVPDAPPGRRGDLLFGVDDNDQLEDFSNLITYSNLAVKFKFFNKNELLNSFGIDLDTVAIEARAMLGSDTLERKTAPARKLLETQVTYLEQLVRQQNRAN